MKAIDENQAADSEFSRFRCSNKDHEEIVSMFSEIFKKNINKENLQQDVRERIAPMLFVSKAV